MIPFLLLAFLSSVFAQNCSFNFDGHQYSRTSMLMIKGVPTNLAYNPNTKDLLFTLIGLDSLQNDDEQAKMGQYVLRRGEPIKIDNVKGQSAAVDVKNNNVYIASEDGLHILNRTDKANFVSLKDEDVVQLFKPTHTDDIYAVVIFPQNEVYQINVKRNEKKKIEYVRGAFILAVDVYDNIYYECDSKYVKVLLKDFHEPIEFAGIAKNTARAISVDGHNRVILATNDGLYHLQPDNLIPKKLMNLDFVPSGVAFDKNDIFLSTNGIIYKYSGQECH